MFLNVLTFLGTAWVLLRVWYAHLSSWSHLLKAEKDLVLAMATAVLGYFIFGLIWNTSEEEFWFRSLRRLSFSLLFFGSTVDIDVLMKPRS